jgi:predicted secreted hydrolase
MKRRPLLLAMPALSLGLPSFAAAPTYPDVLPGQRLTFPRDHGAHPDFRTEWWYVTGALQASTETIGITEAFGFQLTFFRSRLPDNAPEDVPLAARQIMLAHAAISRGSRLRHAQRVARAGLGAGLSSTDCAVWLGSWSIERSIQDLWTLKCVDPQFAFDLTLKPTQPLLLQGDGGYSRKGPEPHQASWYTSWPQLAVSGQLRDGAQTLKVQGRAWYDHEWSSQVLGADGVGWDWLGINLADGGALMAFRIRNRDGATVWAHARLRDSAGNTQSFEASQVRFTTLGTWRSPKLPNALYPVRLRVEFGPYRIDTKPLFDDQELSGGPGGQRYWEGLVRLSGTLSGRGYLELTGYAGKLAL